MSKILYTIVIFSLCTSCASEYISSPMNIPLFEEKGEALVEAGISTNSVFVNASYAFSEKYAAILSSDISFYNFSDISDFAPVRGGEAVIFPTGGDIVAHRTIEAGLGRYNIANVENWHLECFVGLRYGEADNTKKENTHNYYFNNWYLQSFVQINWGKKIKWSELGWVARIAYSYHENGDVQTYHYSKELKYTYSNFNMFHLEPLYFVRFGGKHLKATIRAGFNAGLAWSNGVELYGNPHLSAGLSYRF